MSPILPRFKAGRSESKHEKQEISRRYERRVAESPFPMLLALQTEVAHLRKPQSPTLLLGLRRDEAYL